LIRTSSASTFVPTLPILHVDEGEDQVNPERHDDHFQGGEGEDQIQLSPEKLVDHLHTEEGEYQVQHSPEHYGDQLHAKKG
jgi:hypothetical protein